MTECNIDDLVIVAIGGNLPGPEGSILGNLESALQQFPPSELKITRRSSWWCSRAWPDPSAPDYINGVVIVETELGPREVLAQLAGIEGRFGRQRAEANAPRALDLDLIAHGRTRMRSEMLTLPHPRANDRLFVMGPLAEIAPEWRCPNTGLKASQLAFQARVGRDARPV